MKEAVDFYDIYNYYYQPIWSTIYFKIFIGVLGLFLMSMIVLFILKRGRVAVSPWQWAFTRIEKLNPENCENKSDYKLFYFELTGIVKQYLNRRFDWDTNTKTDDELLKYLQKLGFNKELLESLKKMFGGAVFVKFANEQVLKTQAKTDLGVAKTIVLKTKPSDNEK
jgi:hypothetical protein